MKIKSLAYTSLARFDLTARDLVDIHETARHLNALDGITGLLIFNGTRFLQIVEGSEEAIDALLERLRQDPRHSAIEVRDERHAEARAFPDWSMELLRVSTAAMTARAEIEDALPKGVAPSVRDLILRMSPELVQPVEMPE